MSVLRSLSFSWLGFLAYTVTWSYRQNVHVCANINPEHGSHLTWSPIYAPSITCVVPGIHALVTAALYTGSASQGQAFLGRQRWCENRSISFSFTAMMLDARARVIKMPGNTCSPWHAYQSFNLHVQSWQGRVLVLWIWRVYSCSKHERTVDRTGSKDPLWYWPQTMVPRSQGGERQDFHQIVQVGPIIHCLHPGTFDG